MTTTDFNKLYIRISPLIKKLFDKYFFLELPKDKFEEITKDFLLEIYKKHNNENIDDKKYIEILTKYLDAYTKMTLS